MAAPVRRGEELELQIDSLAYGGNGVARLNGFVVFVRGGLPGDRVSARVTKMKRGFAEATRSEVLEASGDRVEAPCPHFGVCGGCRFQDLAYEAQAAQKEQQVRDSLVRIGRIAERAGRADRAGRVALPLPEQARVLVHGDGGRASTSASIAQAAGTRSSGSTSACSRPISATPSARRCGSGRARRSSCRTTRRPERATSGTSSSARGETRARRSSCSSPRPASASRPGTSSTSSAASRRCARSTGR